MQKVQTPIYSILYNNVVNLTANNFYYQVLILLKTNVNDCFDNFLSLKLDNNSQHK
jgi:hypothetical protein